MANTENVQKWVDALRSGDFTQGKGALEKLVGNKVQHCCLGVACRVAMKNGVNVAIETLTTHYKRTFDHDSSFLPEKVQEWLGILEMDPMLKITLDTEMSCTQANDDPYLGRSFNDIADMIENTYLRTDNGE